MKRLDKLVFKEIIGPWLFGVALFTSLIFATVLLLRITEWAVRGISPGSVGRIIVLLLPGIMVKTFGMSLLLSSLLAFGRLSNDSEIVAIRAAGASVFRIMRPVFLFSLAAAVLAFAINETIVPKAASQATALSTEIKKELSDVKGTRTAFQSITGKSGVVALVGARDLNLIDQVLSGVTITTFDNLGEHAWVVMIEKFKYVGEGDWKIIGKASVHNYKGDWVADIKEGAWPKQVEKPVFTPENLLAGIADDMDVFSFRQFIEEIDRKKKDPLASPRQIANLEFGMFNKIAIPLGALVFGLLGAPLGLRNSRTGVGTGFAVSIVLSFMYLMIVNTLAVYSKSGAIPPWFASFAPVVLGLVAACVAIAKKNV